MNEIEMLRQATLSLTVRLGALETISEGLLIAYAGKDGTDNLRALASWMISAHEQKPLAQGPKELVEWLRNEELRTLRASIELVLLGVDEFLTGKKLVN